MGQRAQLDERHPDALLGLTSIDGDEPNGIVRRRADHRPRVTVLGKPLVEAFNAPILDVAAVADEETGAAYDVLRKEPLFRLTLVGLVRDVEPDARAAAEKLERLGDLLAAER